MVKKKTAHITNQMRTLKTINDQNRNNKMHTTQIICDWLERARAICFTIPAYILKLLYGAGEIYNWTIGWWFLTNVWSLFPPAMVFDRPTNRKSFELDGHGKGVS